MVRHIAVIWWGAAGMICATTIIEQAVSMWVAHQLKIDLYEKNNQLWAKVVISGWGRCNVTTWTFKRKELLTHYTRGSEFLDQVFRTFWPKKVQARFESHWVPLKQEADGRIFPVSDDGHDIVEVFERVFDTYSSIVDVRYKQSVEHVTPSPWWGCTVTVSGTNHQYDQICIATWGQAYAHTWSTWDGYAFARECGHTITPLWPSLNSFVCTQKRIHDCTGISFSNARLHILSWATAKHSWPVLLTHFGVSGPHAFVVASHSAFDEVSEAKPLTVRLQPHADKDLQRRDKFLIEHSFSEPKKQLSTILSYELPKRFVEGYCSTLSWVWVSTATPIGTLSKQQRKQIVADLWWWVELTFIKRRAWDEFVTAGWVVTDEVDKKTMESKLTPWVYFAWEVLNVDGVTWGYNLQASRATWRAAGIAMVNSHLANQS